MARKHAMVQHSGHTILVIDDQEEILLSLRLLLEREGHRVLTALSGEDGLALFRKEQVHLIIVDYLMPKMSGEDFVREIRKFNNGSQVQILLQTGYSGEKPPLEMMRTLEIQGYHSKTDGPEHLLLWVEVMLKAAAQLQQMRETEQLKAELLLIKQEFLASMSHEMRTPLHLILGYSELLLEKNEEEPLPAYAYQAVEVIQKQGRTLAALTTNFLNSVKIETEGLLLNFEHVSFPDVEYELKELMDLLLRGKQVSFSCKVSSQLPLLWADREKLIVILRNALSNAAKFTDRGEILLAAEPAPSGDEVIIQVKDTGAGFTPEHHQATAKVCQPSKDIPRESGIRAGVGLLLSRKLARLMGGDVNVVSAPGVGTTFTVTLKSAPGQSRVKGSCLSAALQDTLNETSEYNSSSPQVPLPRTF